MEIYGFGTKIAEREYFPFLARAEIPKRRNYETISGGRKRFQSVFIDHMLVRPSHLFGGSADRPSSFQI
jgi:hypothetical protein